MNHHLDPAAIGGYAQAAAAATAVAVAAAYPLIGLGVEAKPLIDSTAAAVIAASLARAQQQRLLGPLAIGGCEGGRDDAPAVGLCDWSDPATAANVWCDPIDGTLNAARGGPRAVSGLAFSTAEVTAAHLDDGQSIFAIGSNTIDVSAIFTDPTALTEVIAEHLHTPSVLTATLNRDDNRALLLDLAADVATPIYVGSRSGYRPSIAGAGWVAVGDATLTLPLECDLEFGRIGLVEAQMQSGLYRSWAGLVVSRDTVAEYPGGLACYLHRYLTALAHGDHVGLRALFTPAELARFAEHQASIDTVCAPLHPDHFGIGPRAVTAISTLSGPADPALGLPITAFNNPVWDSERGCLLVDTTIANGTHLTRQTSEVVIEDNTALPHEIRAWYRTLHWADHPGLADLADWAQGHSLANPAVAGVRR